MHQDIVPLVLFMGLFALLFSIFYLRNKENMAMLEKGLNPRENSYRYPHPFISLKFGLLLMGAGLGLFIAYLLDVLMFVGVINTDPLYPSLIGLFGGAGLVISYAFEKKYVERQKDK